MVVHKRKKFRRKRGTRQCGFGESHRGAGERGGRGNAGTGKKADQKKPRIWKEKYFGKKGFTRVRAKKSLKYISIKNLIEKLDFFVNKEFAKKDKDLFIIDLKKAGYNKLLSDGDLKQKVKIVVSSASKKAVEKVKAAGGELVLG